MEGSSISYKQILEKNRPVQRQQGTNKAQNRVATVQLISKANCQAMNSSKKRANEFVFTSVFVCFLKKLRTLQRYFEII